MSRDVVVYLEDMVEAVRRVLEYTNGMTRDALFADKKTLDAVVRNLEVLGEATKHVPDEVRARHGHIAWRQKLPPLSPELERILEDERKRG